MAGSDILDGLEVFLVGGAVRDLLLGLPVGDRDWVVVGATAEEMRSRGFKPVGREFPVFLHPRTREEYALARTERKTGPGYTGFEFSTAEGITLEQDLYRRDLTVNAMAMTPDGTLIDPFHGQRDLRNRLLWHVSNAFVEDPVRILRVARFHARYDFDIAPETWALMRSMVTQGEVDTLVADRIWLELRGALGEKKPSMFFRALRDCGALRRIMPEIDKLFGVPQDPAHHPEIDSGVHTMMVLDRAAKLTDDVVTRFAALLHDLGKATTPQEQWPDHHRHEFTGLKCIKDFCARMRIPNKFRDLALIACETHLALHRIGELDSPGVLALLESTGAFRQPGRLDQIATVAEADWRGRLGLEDQPYPQAGTLRRCFDAASAVDSAAIAKLHHRGIDIAREIRAQRIEAIQTSRGD